MCATGINWKECSFLYFYFNEKIIIFNQNLYTLISAPVEARSITNVLMKQDKGYYGIWFRAASIVNWSFLATLSFKTWNSSSMLVLNYFFILLRTCIWFPFFKRWVHSSIWMLWLTFICRGSLCFRCCLHSLRK